MKKITLKLVGLDGNAFALLGAFQEQARREKWSRQEIDTVIKDATSGDYNHLLCVLMDHCESPASDGDDDICDECGENIDDCWCYCPDCDMIKDRCHCDHDYDE